MNSDDSWTAEWLCKNISHTNIATATQISSNEIEIALKSYHDRFVRVATMSRNVVDASEIQRVHSSTAIEFVINIQKSALYKREALEMSETLAFGLGGLADLYSASADENFRNYVPAEFCFILRVLRQHSHVDEVIRINNRMLLVRRSGKEDELVLALNEYDLTADAVRSGIEKFGRPKVILTSNPNCRPSSESIVAAEYCGIEVCSIGELMSKLRQ